MTDGSFLFSAGRHSSLQSEPDKVHWTNAQSFSGSSDMSNIVPTVLAVEPLQKYNTYVILGHSKPS
jgi:hypothetical protein